MYRRRRFLHLSCKWQTARRKIELMKHDRVSAICWRNGLHERTTTNADEIPKGSIRALLVCHPHHSGKLKETQQKVRRLFYDSGHKRIPKTDLGTCQA